MPRIIMVCTANICRSPVAEAILRDRLQNRGLDDWTVESAGTWAQMERGAARYSIQLMAEQGLDLTQHRARLIEWQHLKDADLILCMESGHVEALRAEFPSQAYKIYLLSEMAGNRYSIRDPFGRSIDEYRRMATDVTEIIDAGLDRITELARSNFTRRTT